jgi:alkanesulfonate monooxygenase SsuD/methylene tetrahydromethanopterin reductase-like flavin-dependent oxidoreductase (luciferase family)
MGSVRYGIILTAGEPRAAAELAAAAEAAGWDGAFTFDGVAIGAMELYDPWVTLAAMATTTERVTLGAIVTPPSRRRPWKLARETMSIDRLSNGRLVLPVGLGALDDGAFGNVGEPTDARTRAELLDESLAILDGLWSGEPFAFAGRHHRFGTMTFRPTPVQRPRIPVWVVGAWPSERSMERAARWDGLMPHVLPYARAEWSPDLLREMVTWVTERRPSQMRGRPYDIVVEGTTAASEGVEAAARVRPWIEAGATWWIESDWEHGSAKALLQRIAAGPPRSEG